MSDLKSETLRGAKWSVFNSVGGKIIGFVISVILARLLSPSDFGIVGMVAIFFSLANVLVDSGFSSSLIRKPDITDKDTSTVFYFNIFISVILFTLLTTCSSLIANYLNAPAVEGIIKLSAITIVVGSFGSVQFALLKKSIDFRKPAIITLVSQILSGIIGIIMAYRGYGPWALVWQSLIAVILRTILVWCFTTWRPKLIFSWSSFKELFGFGGNLAINSVLDIFFQDGIGLIIGKFYTTQQLGFYSRGQGTAQLPSSFLYNAVGNVTFPVLSKIQDDDEKLFGIYRTFMQTFSIVIFFVMVLIIAVAKPLTIVVFTEKWLDSVIYLQLFCVVYMFYHVHALNFNFLLVKGRSDWALKKELINKGVKFLLLIILVRYGVIYVCIAFCCSSLFDILVNTTVTGYLFKYGFKKQVEDFFPYLAISVICCIPAFIMSEYITNSYVSLISGVCLSTALYCAYFIIRKEETFFRIISLTPFKKYIGYNGK